LTAGIPNTYPLTFREIKAATKEVMDCRRKREIWTMEAEKKKLKQQAAVAKKKKLLASMSKEQRALFNEIVK